MILLDHLGDLLVDLHLVHLPGGGSPPTYSSTTFISITLSSGDSGGPLSVVKPGSSRDPVRRVLIGIVSLKGTLRCDQNVPDKYTEVVKYLPWINQLRW